MTADPAPVTPLARPLRLVVYGSPATQGHKTAHAHGGRTWVTETNEANLRPWRALVTAAAAQARGEVLVGPVAVKVIFTLKRPAGLPARHRGADGVLRPYRALPAKRSDLDTCAGQSSARCPMQACGPMTGRW